MLLLPALCFIALAQTATPDPPPVPAAPQYVLSSGISFAESTSSVTTLAVKVAEPFGLPLYQATTLETALVKDPTSGRYVLASSGTVRAGVCQTAYRKGNVSLGGCTDIGATKVGDSVTLGTITGYPYLAWDAGATFTKGKHHVFLIPSVRWIAVNGVQVKPSYALQIGTGF